MKVDSLTSPIKLQPFSCELFKFKIIQEERLESLMREVTALSSKSNLKQRSEVLQRQEKNTPTIIADALLSAISILTSSDSLREKAKRCIESMTSGETNYINDTMTTLFQSIDRLEKDLMRQQQTAHALKVQLELSQRNYEQLTALTNDIIRSGKSITSIECDNPVNLYIRRNELKILIAKTERSMQLHSQASHEARSQKIPHATSTSKEESNQGQTMIKPPLKDISNVMGELKCIRCGLAGEGLLKECVYDSLCARTDENNMVSLVRVTQKAESHKFK